MTEADMTVTSGAPTAPGSRPDTPAATPAHDEVDDGHRHRIRRFLHRLAANKDTHDAVQLQQDVAELGATPIKRCSSGCKVSVLGTIRSITLQPVTGTPALHADLWDGTGSVTLIWLGRRIIPGIDPGRQLLVEGRIIDEHGHQTIYNPRYELRCAPGANGRD
jgi:hypothetical protein